MSSTAQPYPYKEETLLNMASKGSLVFFNELVLTYQNVAFYQAYALLRDTALAEDATQDSFIRAFQNITGFRDGSFRAWILKIVTNSAYDMLRCSKRHPRQSLYPENEYSDEVETPVWLADTTSSVQDSVEQSEFSQDLYQMIDELPDVYRTVLTFVDLHELDYAELADALQIPIGTVKSRLALARLKMSQKLSSVKIGNIAYMIQRKDWGGHHCQNDNILYIYAFKNLEIPRVFTDFISLSGGSNGRSQTTYGSRPFQT